MGTRRSIVHAGGRDIVHCAVAVSMLVVCIFLWGQLDSATRCANSTPDPGSFNREKRGPLHFFRVLCCLNPSGQQLSCGVCGRLFFGSGHLLLSRSLLVRLLWSHGVCSLFGDGLCFFGCGRFLFLGFCQQLCLVVIFHTTTSVVRSLALYEVWRLVVIFHTTKSVQTE